MFKKILIYLIILLSFNLEVYANNNQLSYNSNSITYIRVNNETEPKIYSKSAIVFDRTSKQILYEKDIYETRAMASTTKIMTAILIIENCNLTDTAVVSKKAAKTGGSRLGLKENDKITIHDLLYGLMLCSGNDAAVCLAEYMCGSVKSFANKMNIKALELGLFHTHFVTPHGLDDDEHFTTAYELALLTDYALSNETFAKIVNTKSTTISINGYSKNLTNTNELLGVVEGVNGVKTGFTGNAGRCLVTSCTRDNFNIITIVLGADTKKLRTLDSKNLIEYTYSNYTPYTFQNFIEDEYANWLKHKFQIIKNISELMYKK